MELTDDLGFSQGDNEAAYFVTFGYEDDQQHTLLIFAASKEAATDRFWLNGEAVERTEANHAVSVVVQTESEFHSLS